MSTTPAIRTDTRTALLDSAEALFAEKGYATVGIREIVEHAGANIASVTYHFGGKADLYREVVRRALQRKSTEEAWSVLQPPPGPPAPPIDATEAALRLAQFIHHFMQHLLIKEDSHQLCGLILHEAAEPTDAIAFVVENFMRPHEERLTRTMAVLAPRAERQALSLMAQSILGQMLHYRTYRPFLELLTKRDLSDARHVRDIAMHLARFSLRGLSCPAEIVEAAISQAFDERTSETSPEQ